MRQHEGDRLQREVRRRGLSCGHLTYRLKLQEVTALPCSKHASGLRSAFLHSKNALFSSPQPLPSNFAAAMSTSLVVPVLSTSPIVSTRSQSTAALSTRCAAACSREVCRCCSLDLALSSNPSISPAQSLDRSLGESCIRGTAADSPTRSIVKNGYYGPKSTLARSLDRFSHHHTAAHKQARRHNSQTASGPRVRLPQAPCLP